MAGQRVLAEEPKFFSHCSWLTAVADLTTSALDPKLTREELVGIVQQIDELVNPDDYEDDGNGTD